MSRIVKLLAFSGSTRAGSYNQQLLTDAVTGAREAGAEVNRLDLRAYPVPLYDGDLEAQSGIPENAVKVKNSFMSHDGLLIASPEYNGFFSGVLKNMLDWLSRPVPGEPSLVALRGKTVAIMSASPGALGGVRGLQHLRLLLSNLQMYVIPMQVTLPFAHKEFGEDGLLTDLAKRKKLQELGKSLVEFTSTLTAE